MNLYISDLHFGHTNVIRFDHRPFVGRDEMDAFLIKQWQERVQKDDTVYIIGDFCYHSGNSPEWYLRQLPGQKILVIGNHDKLILENPKAMSYFDEVSPLLQIVDNEKQITLCHFPLTEWPGSHHGTWHIYGHIHNRKNETYEFMKDKKHALNAGCMINNYAPASFKELVENNERFRLY